MFRKVEAKYTKFTLMHFLTTLAGNVTGFEVYVGKNNDLNDDTFCADDPGSATGNTVKLFCGKKMEANYLTILVPGESKRLGICELYVNGGKARRKTEFVIILVSDNAVLIIGAYVETKM